MLKKYPTAPGADVKCSPNNLTINAILNYSKSLEVKKTKETKILVHLN